MWGFQIQGSCYRRFCPFLVGVSVVALPDARGPDYMTDTLTATQLDCCRVTWGCFLKKFTSVVSPQSSSQCVIWDQLLEAYYNFSTGLALASGCNVKCCFWSIKPFMSLHLGTYDCSNQSWPQTATNVSFWGGKES